MRGLYGSRMTGDPLQAVYNATSDAINQLHKSLETCPTMETVAEDPTGLKVSKSQEKPLYSLLPSKLVIPNVSLTLLKLKNTLGNYCGLLILKPTDIRNL